MNRRLTKRISSGLDYLLLGREHREFVHNEREYRKLKREIADSAEEHSQWRAEYEAARIAQAGTFEVEFDPSRSAEVNELALSSLTGRPTLTSAWERIFDPHNDGPYPEVDALVERRDGGASVSVLGPNTSVDWEPGAQRHSVQTQQLADHLSAAWPARLDWAERNLAAKATSNAEQRRGAGTER